ncbi:MAG: DUF5692 family protein [Myxococcota bacterium]
MTTIAWIAAATGLTVVGCWALRRSAPRWGLAVLWGLPLVAAGPWSTSDADFTWFSWVKLASVCLAAGMVVALRMPEVRRRIAAGPVLVAILVLNIGEAMVAEALDWGLTLNVLAAAGLLVALPGPRAIEATDDGVRFELSGLWIAGYSIWNLTFVYGHVYPDSIGPYTAFAIVHLGAPLLTMGRDRGRYMEARALALALLMMWRFSASASASPWMVRTPELFDPAVHELMSMMAAVVAVVAGLEAIVTERGVLGALARRGKGAWA